jgi:hypothetical protein
MRLSSAHVPSANSRSRSRAAPSMRRQTQHFHTVRWYLGAKAQQLHAVRYQQAGFAHADMLMQQPHSTDRSQQHQAPPTHGSQQAHAIRGSQAADSCRHPVPSTTQQSHKACGRLSRHHDRWPPQSLHELCGASGHSKAIGANTACQQIPHDASRCMQQQGAQSLVAEE